MKATITTDPIHIPFLRQTYEFAWAHSDDPDTKNGAVILDHDGKILAFGANRMPFGVKVIPERLQRPEKYSFIEHAERDVIYASAYMGKSLVDATLYVPWFACSDCGRAIIASGIKKVVGHKSIADLTPDHWKASIEVAMQMLDEAGIETLLYDGEIGGVSALFNRKEWKP